jgi:hypothetical protein
LSATNEEVLDLMRCVSAAGFHNISSEDCSMVIDFIADNAEDRQLSMRLLGDGDSEFAPVGIVLALVGATRMRIDGVENPISDGFPAL